MTRHLLAVGAVAALFTSCSSDPQSDADPIETAGALGASAVALNLPATVRPPGGMTGTITVEATLSDVPASATVVLKFKGDASAWVDANLPQTKRKGNKFTFAKSLRAPALPGQHSLSWRFAIVSSGVEFGAPVVGTTEVTCSDGEFCDGEERWSRGKCVAGIDPCDDGVNCTDDICDNLTRTCHFVIPDGETDCLECSADHCVPHCANRQECGDDGCGGPCPAGGTGACPAPAGPSDPELTCVDGKCIDLGNIDGICKNPRPLWGDGNIPAGGLGEVTPEIVLGDTSTGVDAVKVACGGTGIKEIIYKFTLPVAMGIDIRMTAANEDPNALDTVLAVHAGDNTCATTLGFGGFCSDDNSPPGGLSSRVYGPLAAGDYRLIATGYSSAQVGPYKLSVKFVAPSCVPSCDGKFCGPDGCGFSCGGCDDGFECNGVGRCAAVGCTGLCKPGNECGDDGCGMPCGSCATGSSCIIETGKCVVDGTCNHLLPTCKNCGAKEYCGSDCACHKVAEQLIDLMPADASVLIPSIEFEYRQFAAASCGLAEGCVPGPGRWLVMRFTTDIWNQSLAGFKPGNPTQQPDLFSYHACHQHYHFDGFAQYELRSFDGTKTAAGRKLSYCMEDSYQYQEGPRFGCEPESTCDNQGIAGGWADSYPNTLDCQWLVLKAAADTTPPPDFVPVPLGQWYKHRTCTNTGRVFPEETFANNCIDVDVYLPSIPDDGNTYRYVTFPPPPPKP